MRIALVVALAVGACGVPDATLVDGSINGTIGGTVTGMVGTGLVLQNLGGDNAAVTADGTFVFARPIATGMSYSVTVQTQPSAPSQTCTVTNGTGIVGGSDVTNVSVTCTTEPFKISGSVTGLLGSGLVLANNTGDDLAIAADGAFSFAHGVPSGSSYAVTVKTQPSAPSQTCTVVGGLGTVGSANVDTVTVTCQRSVFSIGGMVTGLAGGGLVLQNNGGDDLAIAANGVFMFSTPTASGMAYAVTVRAQPGSPSQACTVTGASGTVSGTAITSVVVSCVTRTFTVGGTVSGLVGSGLVVRNNGADNLTVSANGSFTFATAIDSGATYAVTVASSPSTPSQTCTVAGAAGSVGSGNVGNVMITCTTNSYTVGGTVTGLAGGGLVLRDRGGDDLPITSNGAFTFATPVPSLGTYSVTIASSPSLPSQTCTVSNASGVIGAANISSVAISCATKTFTIGGTISGLQGSGLVLQNSAGDNLAVPANATTFTFATRVASGAVYNVTILTQPSSPTQTCSVSAGASTVGAADVTGVVISCAANRYTVGGTVSGLAGTGLVLQDNGGDNLAITGAGSFAFATTVASGAAYSVSVLAQPSAPKQTCTVAMGTGSAGAMNVTTVAVTCTTNTYTIGGTVSGLVGTGLVLQDNGGDNLAISANGAFTFATRIASGATYTVTAATQPGSPSQTCTLADTASGSVTATNITNVALTCSTNAYAISGTVSGLTGTGLRLLDNGGNSLAINTNGAFQFSTWIASGQTYSVTIGTQPSSPTQTCSVSSGSGTVTSAPVGNVSVTCTTNSYSVGGAVTGFAGSGLTLQNTVNGAPLENIAIGANGTFTFPTAIASGSVFAVAVLIQPTNPAQTCTVSGGTGTIGAANVASVGITCTINRYFIGGTISGLLGSGLTLKNNGGDTIVIPAGQANFNFATKLTSGMSYSVSIAAQPTGPIQTCTITGATGTVTNANISSVAISCPTDAYPVGFVVNATLNTLRAGLVLQNNGGDDLAAPTVGGYFFATQILVGNPYSVTIASQPLAETCTVTNGSGTITGPGIPPITVTCVPANLAFVTSTTYLAGSLGGVAAADTACQARANSAGLQGTFVAWLSTSSVSAVSRLGTTARGWYRVDGLPIADTVTSLITEHMLYPIAVDELGHRFNSAVITGTEATGVYSGLGLNCNDFTNPNGGLAVGWALGGADAWTSWAGSSCNQAMPIYCFGVSYAAPVAVAPKPFRYAFTTKSTFIPSGGLAAADGQCSADAAAAGLPGTYKAFLATDTASALSRFDTTRSPWARSDGVMLAPTAGAIASYQSGWSALADRAADGTAVHGYVWSRNNPSTNSCQNWTSTSSALTGDMSLADYTSYGSLPCNFTNVHLLCFQD